MLTLQAKAYTVFYSGCTSEERRHAFLKGQNERSIRPTWVLFAHRAPDATQERLAAMARDYLDHPRAVPNCPCVVHKLCAPQADVVQRVMKTDGYVDFAGAFHRFER